jgi:tetratricopeptide (TPR) repeat protein
MRLAPLGLPIGTDPDTRRSFARVLGRAVWRHLPLPRLEFHPEPVPEIGRNDRCPCGSGRKYKQCCQVAESNVPRFTTEALWPFVLEALDRKQVDALLQAGRVPLSSVAQYVERCLDREAAPAARRALEAVFKAPIPRHDLAAEMLFDQLCDLYDEAGQRAAKLRFIERVLSEAPKGSPARLGALSRMASIVADEGRFEAAWQHVRDAQREDPEYRALPAIELQLLIAERRFDEAARRAAYWRQRVRRRNDPDDEALLDLLDRIEADPRGALDSVALESLDPAAAALLAWLDDALESPPAGYSLECSTADAVIAALEPPAAVRQLERQWFTQGLNDPSSGFLDENATWAPEFAARRLEWLQRHPAALDSLQILEQLVEALERLPPPADLSAMTTTGRRLLERAAGIVGEATRNLPEGAALHWAVLENRPGLRCLERLSLLLRDLEDKDAGRALAARVLQLNPNDNQGLRATVINDLLALGRNDEAVALAGRYPEDFLAETLYGAALARFRRGDADAGEALLTAIRRLPEVPRYLLKPGLKAPKLHPAGMRIGGRDQAWLYAQDAGPLWRETPGALDWLRATAKR